MALHKTKGIFFHKINFSETSLVAKIYTEKFGMQSFLIKGGRSKKSKFKTNLLQHLSLLNMVVYHKESSNLQIIKEFSIDYHFSELHYNIVKSSITVFINEVLYRVVKEEEANPQLFEFLYNAIQFLDITDGNINNFHLMFLVKLSQFLGFYPSGIFSEKTPYFDMMEGGFKAEVPLHSYCLNEEESKILGELKLLPFDKSDLIKLTSLQRNVMIDNLLAFYKLHIPNFSEIKSREVLKVVFS